MHHLDLTSKLPWLRQQKKASKKAATDEEMMEGEREGGDGAEDVPLQPETDALVGTSKQATPTSHAPPQLQTVPEGPSGGTLPPLPPRDYDLSPDLPPRDYPTHSPDQVKQPEQNGDLISDDDYYAHMMNALNP